MKLMLYPNPFSLEPSRFHAGDSSQDLVAGTENLHVQRFDSWISAESLEPFWNDLLAESPSNTVFLTWEWLTAWWKAYGGSRRLLILTCIDRTGAMVGIAPLYCDRRPVVAGFSFRVLRFVGDGTHDSDNLNFIVRKGMEDSAIRAWSDWLERHHREWDLLELNSLPAESCFAPLMREESRRRRWIMMSDETPHALVCLPSEWPSYLALLSSTMRSLIQRRIRHLERHHRVSCWKCKTATDLTAALDQLFRLHGKRWDARGGPGAFVDDQRRDLLVDVTRRFMDRGWLDLWSLEVDGQVVAMEIGFRYHTTYYFFQAGFDPDWYQKSVGLVLKATIMRHLIENGVQFYDFLAGGDDYRFRWGPELRSYLSLRLTRSFSRGGLFIRLLGFTLSAKESLRRQIPASVWSFLRRSYRRFRPLQS